MPIGVVDIIESPTTNTIHVVGWAFDPDVKNSSLDIHVYVGGSASSSVPCYVIKANKKRTDVNNVYGCGEYHGFDGTITINKTGNVDVYVYAIDGNGVNANPVIGSKTISIHTHTYTATVTKTATCMEDGIITFSCKCGYTKNDSVKKLGHKIVNDVEKKPTCTQTGLTKGSHCERCGAVIESQKTIKETGHNWGEWTIVTPATETKCGTKTRVCKNDSTHIETETIPKTVTDKQPVTRIDLDRYYLSININETKQLEATVFPDNAGDKTVTWTSDNPSIATVDNKGNVTGNKEGSTTVIVTANDGSGIYASCVICVEKNQDHHDNDDRDDNDNDNNNDNNGDNNDNNDNNDLLTYGTLTTSGIYCASTLPSIVAGMVTEKSNPSDVIEYRWIACEEKDPNKWFEISPWKKNNEWLNWTPEKSGNYVIVGQARIVGNNNSQSQASFGTPYHKYIKGICQMPYEGGGYLIGIESFDNPNNSYKYEMLILDCTLYAQGLPAWTYSTGKCYASGNCLWTVWQPEYGYYWTLFRIYDENDNLIDEACFGFENIF